MKMNWIEKGDRKVFQMKIKLNQIKSDSENVPTIVYLQ